MTTKEKVLHVLMSILQSAQAGERAAIDKWKSLSAQTNANPGTAEVMDEAKQKLVAAQAAKAAAVAAGTGSAG